MIQTLTLSLGKSSPTFRKNVVTSSSGQISSRKLGLLDPVGQCITSLRNVGKCSPSDKPSISQDLNPRLFNYFFRGSEYGLSN